MKRHGGKLNAHYHVKEDKLRKIIDSIYDSNYDILEKTKQQS